MPSFADFFTLYCAKKSPREAGRAICDTLGNVADALEKKRLPGENSCNVYHTSIYNWYSCSDMQWHSVIKTVTQARLLGLRLNRWSPAFTERTRKPYVQEHRSQNWCASPVITSANTNRSPPVFHFSNSAWVGRLNVCISMKQGKSILFHAISPSHCIWLSLFLKSCSSYLELSSSIYSMVCLLVLNLL